MLFYLQMQSVHICYQALVSVAPLIELVSLDRQSCIQGDHLSGKKLEMSGNLTAVREMSGILLKIREISGKKILSGK